MQDVQFTPLFGSKGGQHPLAGLIDHSETYGPHIIDRFIRSLRDVKIAADLGAGSGRDLGIVKRAYPAATTIAIEAGHTYADALRSKIDRVEVLNIERDQLPFADESVDLIMANQVLEHTKEVFWIFHEVSRSLEVGGHFLFGVPNIASFHNRLLLLLGRQPTQHKLCSAHVRPFSKGDTMTFLNVCFPGGYELAAFAGAQFYPFPPKLARIFSGLFPQSAFSIFFLIRKTKPYAGEFVTYPVQAALETNFWLGNPESGGQYR
jgi:SAM-dependent methyltransferase